MAKARKIRKVVRDLPIKFRFYNGRVQGVVDCQAEYRLVLSGAMLDRIARLRDRLPEGRKYEGLVILGIGQRSVAIRFGGDAEWSPGPANHTEAKLEPEMFCRNIGKTY